ncbi:MAG: MFS transporter [Planctomycetaceae bacterium]
MTTKNRLLYLICMLTDFAVFIEVFTVSRGLAEAGAEPYYLGIVGAGFSLTAGVASVLGGWLAHRYDSRTIFQIGAGLIVLTIRESILVSDTSLLLAIYWLQGIGLGFLYPPLIGWLNQDVDAHANSQGVSRTLILFCVAWNFGMMCGQLTAGSLFKVGPEWALMFALFVATINLVVATIVVRLPSPRVQTEAKVSAEPHPDAQLATSFKRLSWIANLGGMFGGSMIVHLLPDLAVHIGIQSDDHGYLLASWRAVIIATYFVMHYLAFWHYRFGIAVVSQVFGAAGLIVISQADSGFTLLIGLTLLGQLVGYNYFSGLFYSTAGSSNESRALAAGIHEATLAAGMAVGTIVGGALGSLYGHRVPYVMSAAVLLTLVAVQGVAWRSWVRPIHRRRESEMLEDLSVLNDGVSVDAACATSE